LEYDLHLSAMRILPKTVSALGETGFARDEFLNNTRCAANLSCGTYKMQLHGKQVVSEHSLARREQGLSPLCAFWGTKCIPDISSDSRHAAHAL